MRIILLLIGYPIAFATAAGAEAVRWECSFDRFCDGGKECSATEFSMEFSLDTVTRDAFIVGNNGISPVQVYRGADSSTFLEPLKSGAIQTTTIGDSGAAVHSRHTIIAGELTPSQYVGTCDVKER